jgi:hypothetical protein
MRDDHFPTMGYWARVTLTVTAIVALLVAAWTVRSILLLVLVSTVLAVGLAPHVASSVGSASRRRRGRRPNAGSTRPSRPGSGAGIALLVYVAHHDISASGKLVGPTTSRSGMRFRTKAVRG